MEGIKRKFYTSGYLVFVLILTAVAIWLLSFIQSIVVILIASIFLAYLLIPMVRFFENPIHLLIPDKIKILKKEFKIAKAKKKVVIREKGFGRLASILIVYLIMMLIFLVILAYVIPRLSLEFNDLMHSMPKLSAEMQERLEKMNRDLQPRLPAQYKDIIPRTVEKYTNEAEKYAYEGATYVVGFVRSVLSTALTVLVIPIFTFYILIDVEKFKAGFYLMVPPNRREEIEGLMREIDLLMGRYIRGQISVSIFVAVAIAIALTLMGIDFALLIGLLSGLVNFIPYLGVIISIAPAAIIAILNKGLLWSLLVITVLVIIQQVEGQVVSPAIMGEAVGLPPLIIILSLVIGGQLMGLVGMLIAIPLVAIVRVIINYYIKRRKEKEKQPSPA